MREMLLSELACAQDQDSRAKKKGKAKTNDKGESSSNLPPPKNETLIENEKMV